MSNHLEQLIGEWLEHQGYFVRRNVKVGKLAQSLPHAYAPHAMVITVWCVICLFLGGAHYTLYAGEPVKVSSFAGINLFF